ncbi:MAG: hypothetical protein IH840_03825 [Candidatus Heimdallarchaeota archaeon]|nr:hypothetical protein [Candidatus Heimdallarchaeota archaeon]
MRPQLNAVIVEEFSEDSTKVLIKYRGNHDLHGIELHGVDADLSWLKGESKQLIPSDDDEQDYLIYSLQIILEHQCEFRARGYEDDDDYWEERNHILKRNKDGSIELETEEEVMALLDYRPIAPRIAPKLMGIHLLNIKDDHSVVQIIYRGSPQLENAELQGIDGHEENRASLSWTKNESVMMEQLGEIEDDPVFVIQIILTTSIEFRARGSYNLVDHWESGENHKIFRHEDGTIGLDLNDIVLEQLDFKNKFPLNFEPTQDESLKCLRLESATKPTVLQFLIYVSNWYTAYMKDPFNQDMFTLIPRMVRYIKTATRKLRSAKVDELVLPITHALYDIYSSVILFIDEDEDQLKEILKGKKLELVFDPMLEKVKRLDTENIGDEEDREVRLRLLWRDYL